MNIGWTYQTPRHGNTSPSSLRTISGVPGPIRRPASYPPPKRL